MNKSNLRYPIIFGALLLTILFFGLSPAKASAYTCAATVTNGSITAGGTATVRVDVTGATVATPVYVYSQPQAGGHIGISLSIDSCVKNSARVALGYNDCVDNGGGVSTEVSAPGSVNINASTNSSTVTGTHNFNIFCSTNLSLAYASQGVGADNAQNVQQLAAPYTVASGGSDCELTGGSGISLAVQGFNGGTIPPNFIVATSTTKVFTVTNSGSTPATLSIDSQTSGITTATLGTTTLGAGATTNLTVALSSSANNESFNLNSSCGGATHTYHLTGAIPFVCSGNCVSPPPPPPAGGFGPDDFPILIAGGPITITEGQTITRAVVVGNPKGYTADITIKGERANLPPGVNVTFSPSEGIVSTGMAFLTTATFRADGLVLAGTYNYRLRIDPATGHSDGSFTYFKMTTQNKVLPAKTMPATVNTLRASVANMLNMTIETPGQTSNPCHPYMCLNEYDTDVGNFVFSVKSWANPVMILDSAHYDADMGARYYSLADPMNPAHDSSKDITLDNHYAGDFGPQMYPWSLAYSRDGGYEVGSQWNQGTVGSTPEFRTNGAYTGIPFDMDDSGSSVSDIFQSKSHVYFTYLNKGGVYRLDGVKKSPTYLSVGGTPTFDWIKPELPDTAPNIPLASGTTGVHTTVMSGATTDYIAALTGVGDWRTVSVPKKLSIYSAGDSGPVAEINIATASATSVGVVGLTSFVTADVQYVMFTTLNYVQNGAKPGDANYYIERSDPKQWENKLYVYKFDPKTGTLTKVVEGLKFLGQLSASGGGAMAGIRVGTKDGVAMILYDDLSKGDPNRDPTYPPTAFWKLKIFMFSDLAAGNLKDVYQDAGYSISPSPTSNAKIASLNIGVSTYVYLDTGTRDGYRNSATGAYVSSGKGIAVLRFGPFGVNVPPVVPPPPAQQHLACVSNSCGLVSGAGANSCSTDADCAGVPPSGGGGGGGGGAPAGSCDVALTPSPSAVSATVSSGQSSTVSFSISSTRPADTTCPSVSLSLSSLKDGSGNTVATPLSTSLTVSAGNSNVAIYNVNSFQGTYNLSIKAYGRGLQKTITVPLSVTVK